MREIKFRAWDKSNKKMFYGCTGFEFEGDGCVYLNVIQADFGASHEPIIEQYTGLKDRNGKDIYEGDVIQTYFSFSPGDAGYGVSQSPFVVKWDHKRVAYRAKKPKTKGLHLLDVVDFFQAQSNLYEAIGNIHESPELLEATTP